MSTEGTDDLKRSRPWLDVAIVLLLIAIVVMGVKIYEDPVVSANDPDFSQVKEQGGTREVEWGKARYERPDPAEETAAMHRGLEQLKILAESQGRFTQGQYFEKLGLGVYKTSHNRIYRVPDRAAVHKRLQEKMISIPGHAEFYDKRIQGHLQRAKKFEGTDRQFGFATSLMDRAGPDFRILSLLPSPETVRVLGELLSEDWVILRNGQPFNRRLAGFAMSSLHRMPFVSKPVQGDYVSDERDLETYRLWYAQIKAGNRTFRFEGDPNEYNLDGPVSTSPE
jgi:hypothetical protein